MNIEYRDTSLIKKAKDNLSNMDSLSICFRDRDAQAISKRVSLLQEMEAKSDKKEVSRVPAWKFLFEYIFLTLRFGRFMVVFWMAMADGRTMRVHKLDHNLSLEIAFDKK